MIELKAKQKKYLKSLINNETPTIQIGKDGITTNLIKHINDVLKSNELVRIKILDTDFLPLKETATNISDKTSANVIKIIGKIFVLYKESGELEDKEKILLPSG